MYKDGNGMNQEARTAMLCLTWGVALVLVFIGVIFALTEYDSVLTGRQNQQFISQCEKLGGVASIDSENDTRSCVSGGAVLISQK